jgi:drug/metabolite transporter (DMT)-like permease
VHYTLGVPDAADMRHDSASGLARILVAAVTWGTIPVVYALLTRVSPPVVVFWRVCLSGIAMTAIGAFTGDLAGLRRLPRRTLGALALNGALLALNWVLFFTGLRLAGVAVGEILGYVGPVFVAVLTPLTLRLPFDRRIVLPLALALGGTAVILLSTVGGPRYGPNVPLGAALAAGSSLTYALLILNSKRLLAGVTTVTLMIAEDVTAAVLLLPVALLMPGPRGPVEWGALAVIALVHTVLTGFLFVSGLRRVRPDHAAVLTYAEPASAVVFGALLLHQPVTLAIVLGGAAVVVAGALVARLGTGYGQEVPTADGGGMGGAAG